jgi:hypothetical protein
MSFDIRDYIVVLEDLVSHTLCDEIISEYCIHDIDWLNAPTKGGVNKNVRNCDVINISDKYVIQKNLYKREQIDKQLFDCVAKAIDLYIKTIPYRGKKDKFNIKGDSGYSLLRYKKGEFYSQHTDHCLQAPRILSCSIALNDDFDKDGTADAFDYDDDADGLITYREVINPLTGLPYLDSEFDLLKTSSIENFGCIAPIGTIYFKDKARKRTVKTNGTVVTECN